MSERVVPVLRLAVLCEDVVYDGEGEPFALEVPVHTIRLAPDADGRIRPPDLKLYLQLSDGLGTFFLAAEIRTEGGTVVSQTKPRLEVVFDGTSHRAVPMELALDVHDISLRGYGLYEILVFCNHASLHDPRGRVPVPFPPIRVSAVSPNTRKGD
jgi:hypothetical protein